MGVEHWPGIAERLLAAGLAPDTSAAAVRWGSRPEHTPPEPSWQRWATIRWLLRR